MKFGDRLVIETAIMWAIRAHQGQRDKAGAPYILHPFAVVSLLYNPTPEEIATAILHDVIEDSDVSLENLRTAGIPEVVLDAVEAITKRDGEDYSDYLSRVAANPIARRVKLADLTHNSQVSRIPNPTDKDFARISKYQSAIARLTAAEG